MERVADTAKGLAIILAAVSMVGGAAWLAVRNPEPIREKTSLCAPVENGHTIVLVDKTDLWNDAQADRLEDHIWWLVSEKMRTEERLSIFAFSDQVVPGLRPLFSFCKPPSGDSADDITKSRAYYNRQYKREFIEPLRSVLKNVKRPEEKECAPIMETLLDILTRREVFEHHGPNRIVIISDLAQNSSMYSVYLSTKCIPGRDPNVDHRQDTSKIVAYILDRADRINKRDLSAIMFQIVPKDDPSYIAKDVKYRWNAFFKYFGVVPDWQLL